MEKKKNVRKSLLLLILGRRRRPFGKSRASEEDG